MAFDPHTNGALSTVAVAPSPATSGTTLTPTDTSFFPDPATVGQYNVVLWPPNTQPTASNMEIVRVTAKGGGGALTVTRTQEGTSARTVTTSFQIGIAPTKKTFTDIEVNPTWVNPGSYVLLTLQAAGAFGAYLKLITDGATNAVMTDVTGDLNFDADPTSSIGKIVHSGAVTDSFKVNAGVFYGGVPTNRVALGGSLPSGEKGLQIAYGDVVANKVSIQGNHSGTALRELLLNPSGAGVHIVVWGHVGGTTAPTNASTGHLTVDTAVFSPTIQGSITNAASGTITIQGTSHATVGTTKIEPSGGKVAIGVASVNVGVVEVDTLARSTAFAADTTATWADILVRNPSSTSGAATGIGFVVHNGYQSNGVIGIAAVSTNASDFSQDLVFITRQDGTVATEYMRLTGTGRLGIGLTNPSKLLELSADSAQKPTTNTWTITSDARSKDNIRDFSEGLDVLRQLPVRQWEFNGRFGTAAGVHSMGFVAQEIEGVAPYMVKTRPDDDDHRDYEGHALPFLLVNAVKELDARLRALEAA